MRVAGSQRPKRRKKMEKSLDVAKLEAEITKLTAETMKLVSESIKLDRERRWMPFVCVSTLIGICFAIVKFLQ
ncbi:hypothetical protein C0Z20_21100 [Trinickia symbiotica]|uniref:Uncharacterized protein n=2 Tax=Burkholderiaceae TaxID=119060 RepID=A0A2N7WZW0_9BURK|nr:hypothetical protein C0Z20_21100 [Trinickia symbiotica]